MAESVKTEYKYHTYKHIFYEITTYQDPNKADIMLLGMYKFFNMNAFDSNSTEPPEDTNVSVHDKSVQVGSVSSESEFNRSKTEFLHALLRDLNQPKWLLDRYNITYENERKIRNTSEGSLGMFRSIAEEHDTVLSKEYIKIYPKINLHDQDPTVYSPSLYEKPIDFFFEITIKCKESFLSKIPVLVVNVFSLESSYTTTPTFTTDSNAYPLDKSPGYDALATAILPPSLSLSYMSHQPNNKCDTYEVYPWISREPTHEQNISFGTDNIDERKIRTGFAREDPSTYSVGLPEEYENISSGVDVKAIVVYISSTCHNIRQKILEGIPQIIDSNQSLCPHCRRKLVGNIR